MPWNQRSSCGDDDVDLLQEALLIALQGMADDADEAGKVRVGRLKERLARPPVPTGLVREVTALTSMLKGQGGPQQPDAKETVAGMARSLTRALEMSCLLDQPLRDQIADLGQSIPPKVGKGDARRITRDADDLRKAAGPVRTRAVAERREVHRMVQEVVTELTPALKHCNTIDWGIAELSDAMVTSYQPEGVRSVRHEVVGMIRDLAGTAGALRGQLARTHRRVQELENRMAAQQRALRDARENADRDPLTSLYNRGAFDRLLLDAVRVSRADKGPLALVLLDMDHFKKVNDVHGHPAGDQVLRALATCLRAHVRGDDVVARVGGEEFAVVVPGADLDTVLGVVERVRTAMESQSFRSEAGSFSVTISAGVAQMLEFEPPVDFYKRTDKALYNAKHGGRNRYVVAA